MFCKEPLAIEVNGADEKVKVSPSMKRWEVDEVEVWSPACGCRRSQVHTRASPSAHRVANSLWLHRLSGVLFEDHSSGRLLQSGNVGLHQSLRKSFVHVGDRSQGARRGMGRGTRLPLQKLMALSMAFSAYDL